MSVLTIGYNRNASLFFARPATQNALDVPLIFDRYELRLD